MPRVEWPLRHGRPCLQIMLTLAPGGRSLPRMLLADSGAGSRSSGFDLILDEDDCLLCGGVAGAAVKLGGAYVGAFPLYDLRVQLPALGFAKDLRVVGVNSASLPFDGIACFHFLNGFHYGNFGNRGIFGLES